MAWESRRSGQYYYRKRKENGQVISEYVGSGLIAELATLTEGRERHERTMARLHLEDFKQEQARIDRAVGTYQTTVRKLVATVLQAAGFHQHKRQWRMKRQGEDRKMADETQVQAGRQIFEEYNKLLAAASVDKPKAADLERLRQYGFDHPGLFEGFSMLARTTINDVIDSCNSNQATKIIIRGEVRALEDSLGYKTASPLEKLLIKDVSLCWVRMHFFEQTYSHRHSTGDGVSLTYADYLERRLSATQRRFLRATEALARVRGLLARAGVQLNIAQNQVVVNGG